MSCGSPPTNTFLEYVSEERVPEIGMIFLGRALTAVGLRLLVVVGSASNTTLSALSRLLS